MQEIKEAPSELTLACSFILGQGVASLPTVALERAHGVHTQVVTGSLVHLTLVDIYTLLVVCVQLISRSRTSARVGPSCVDTQVGAASIPYPTLVNICKAPKEF